jgi:hypothetical protein
MKELPVFSPTRTAAWDRCSTLSLLQHEGWEPRVAGPSLLGRIAGSAFNEGSLSLCRAWQAGEVGNIELASASAVALLTATAERYCAAGVGIKPDDLDNLKGQVTRALERYAEFKPLEGYKILATELTLEDYGSCRIDLVLERNGEVYVCDVKFKRQLEARYVERTIDDYLQSWQFTHYTWSYRRVVGHTNVEPMLLLVSGAPRFLCRLVPGRVLPEAMVTWEQSAKQHWRDMAAEYAGERSVTMSTVHRDQFGPCPFYEACFTHHLDAGLMQSTYAKVPRDNG